MRDDIIIEDSDVVEALRRLPETDYNDRMFRFKRALDLSMKQQILPKDQWTKFEEVLTIFLSFHKTYILFLAKWDFLKNLNDFFRKQVLLTRT